MANLMIILSSITLVLFLVMATHPTPIKSAPAPQLNVTRQSAINSTDPRWRMVAGGRISSTYTFYQQVVAMQQEQLVSINGTSKGLLGTVLKGVCNLLSFRELLSGVDNSSDLYLLLTQNIVDSCTWLNYLVANNENVTGSEEFLYLNDTCTPTQTPRLDYYCLQMKIREPDELIRLLQHTINDGLSTYYPTPVTESQQCQWLQTSSTITDDTRNRVESRANLYCTN